MDENKSITYDDLIQTRNTQILKSIVPFLDVPTQKPLAMLIQLMEWKNATAAFSRQENSMAACSLPAGTKRRDAMLSAVRLIPYRHCFVLWKIRICFTIHKSAGGF